MADTDFSTLENIFRMMAPADLLGAQKLALKKSGSDETVRSVMNIIFGSAGALPTGVLADKLGEVVAKADDGSKQQLRKIFSMLDSDGNYKKLQAVGAQSAAAPVALGIDGSTTKEITFDELVGVGNELSDKNKTFAIMLLNSPYISPAVRNAEHVEMFLNSIPSFVASRMIPYLDVEFAFKSYIDSQQKSGTVIHAPGLLKFLLGASEAKGDATQALVKGHELVDETGAQQKTTLATTTMGMEAFTSPQTLVDPTAPPSGGRYVDVLDPFRPFMSVESFNVSVTPTVGLFCYEKATLTLKLHDRSRLAEISDLIRPQVYQSELTAPTVWVTYGWRHPPEEGNPYAEWINRRFLVRKAYHIINTQFTFDQVGQVTLVIELWMKGSTELRLKRIDSAPGGVLKVFEDIKQIANEVAKQSRILGIGDAGGVSSEIRGFQLIEAAERGTFPDMAVPEVLKAIDDLKKSLAVPGKPANAAAEALVDKVKSLYTSKDKTNFDFKNKIKEQATAIVQKRFEDVINANDPFLPTPAKDDKRSRDVSGPPTSLASAVASFNKEKDIKGLGFSFKNKLVSLGKLISVFVGQLLPTFDGVDELQLYFHQFNDKAGLVSAMNIAEFPIDMYVFLDQFREHVERKGTDRLTLDEFLKLVIDAQVDDVRALGYGFRSFFQPYDPTNKHSPQLVSDKQQAYENALTGLDGRGPFQKPVIEFYAETVYARQDVEPGDALAQFELQAASQLRPVDGNYKRIMRLFVFDKTNNPYKVPKAVLRSDSGSDPSFIEVTDDFRAAYTPGQDVQAFKQLVSKNVLTTDAKLRAPFNNQQVKEFVSRAIPTIVYGSNASTVINASLASKQDPLMATVQMQTVLKSGRAGVGQPNGSGAGGLPLRVIPASMTMTTLGCPLLSFGQLFFIDFNTGTTIDNIYNLTGVTHTIAPGKFESQLTLTFADAYGKYEGARTQQQFIEELGERIKTLASAKG